jgi:hypothetical protein
MRPFIKDNRVRQAKRSPRMRPRHGQAFEYQQVTRRHEVDELCVYQLHWAQDHPMDGYEPARINFCFYES